MIMNLDILHYKSEIDRLSGMAKEFKDHGRIEKADGYESYIDMLRLRLNRLEMIEYREAEGEYL